jgi:anti-anti-sigma factor
MAPPEMEPCIDQRPAMSCSTLPVPVRAVPKTIMIDIEKKDDVCLLRFRGNFHTGEDPDYLRAKMEEIKSVNCPKVLADFEDVPLVGSTGISFLVELYRNSGGRFVLVKTQRRVREVLDITRLSTVFPLAADVESGMAALNSEASVESGVPAFASAS